MKTDTEHNHGPLRIGRFEASPLAKGGAVLRIQDERDFEAAMDLDAEQVEQLVVWLLRDEPLAHRKSANFRDQLVKHLRTQLGPSGILHFKSKHSGAATWMAERLGLSVMATCRYLTEKALPEPEVAMQLSQILDWPYQEMVETIAETHVERSRARITERYRGKR